MVGHQYMVRSGMSGSSSSLPRYQINEDCAVQLYGHPEIERLIQDRPSVTIMKSGQEFTESLEHCTTFIFSSVYPLGPGHGNDVAVWGPPGPPAGCPHHPVLTYRCRQPDKSSWLHGFLALQRGGRRKLFCLD